MIAVWIGGTLAAASLTIAMGIGVTIWTHLVTRTPPAVQQDQQRRGGGSR